jgi:hypothetical protein
MNSPLNRNNHNVRGEVIISKQVYIELIPDLEACVETQARRRYNQLTSQLLGNSKESQLAGKLELLRWFLEPASGSSLIS